LATYALYTLVTCINFLQIANTRAWPKILPGQDQGQVRVRVSSGLQMAGSSMWPDFRQVHHECYYPSRRMEIKGLLALCSIPDGWVQIHS